MKMLLKGILALTIFFVGVVIYCGYMFFWIDKNTTYTITNCNLEQEEVILKETNILLPSSAIINKIIYYSTWGNDTPRDFNIVITMDDSDYDQFEKSLPTDTDFYISCKVIKRTNQLCEVKVSYTSHCYTSLAKWVKDNGQENTKYKRAVAISGFLVIVFVSAIPLIPFKKIFKPL